MDKYVLNINQLQKGDILLKRDDSRESKLIREYTNSEYSHAMLYVGEGSVIHSDGLGVESVNVQRIGVDSPDDIVVLRIKHPYDINFEQVELYARSEIGKEYGSAEARQVITGNKSIDGRFSNRQYCTKFVAMAYEYGGLNIVNDATLCSTHDILISDKLQCILNVTHKATNEELTLIMETDHVLAQQTEATNDLLEKVRTATGLDIQTIDQMVLICYERRDVDAKVAPLCNNHPYFHLLEVHHQKNPEEYDLQLFSDKFGDYAVWEAIRLIGYSEKVLHQYKLELTKYLYMQSETNSNTIPYFIELYTKLVDDCRDRIEMLLYYLRMYYLQS